MGREPGRMPRSRAFRRGAGGAQSLGVRSGVHRHLRMAGLGSSDRVAARRGRRVDRSGSGSEAGLSHQCTTFVAEMWTDATRAEKLIGWILAWRHHHENRECWMSEKEIARRAPMTERHVERVLASLFAKCKLERPVKGGGRGGRISSFVFVGFEAWVASRYPAKKRESGDEQYPTSAPEYPTSAPEIPDIHAVAIRKTGSTGERISGGTNSAPPLISLHDFHKTTSMRVIFARWPRPGSIWPSGIPRAQLEEAA